MKRLIFSIFLLSYSLVLFAQGGEDVQYPYQKRIKRYQSVWSKIIPSHTKIQYAGSMGFLSYGLGWGYGKKNRLETDLFLGFIPKYSTDKARMTMTLKQDYMPWDIKIGKSNFSFEPLSIGLYITTIFGRKYWLSNPGYYYPKGYYGFSTKIRFNIYLGQRFTYSFPSHKRKFRRSITLYYELNSSDLYIIQAVDNKHLNLKDYIKLSIGAKAQIF
jgi:hypothetical protein